MKISPFLEYHLQNHETCLNCDQARAQLSSKSNSKLMNYKNGKTKSIHITFYIATQLSAIITILTVAELTSFLTYSLIDILLNLYGLQVVRGMATPILPP